MKTKNTKMEFTKKINEVDFIASLILNMAKTENLQFIYLKGEIGSGKTTLVKEIAKQLGEEENVISPTFNKMFVYNNLVHIDAYNLKNQVLDSYEDYFEDKVVIIEWPEELREIPESSYQVEIQFVDETTRKYIITWKEK